MNTMVDEVSCGKRLLLLVFLRYKESSSEPIASSSVVILLFFGLSIDRSERAKKTGLGMSGQDALKNTSETGTGVFIEKVIK